MICRDSDRRRRASDEGAGIGKNVKIVFVILMVPKQKEPKSQNTHKKCLREGILLKTLSAIKSRKRLA